MTKETMIQEIRKMATRDFKRNTPTDGISGSLIKYALTGNLSNDTISNSKALVTYMGAYSAAEYESITEDTRK